MASGALGHPHRRAGADPTHHHHRRARLAGSADLCTALRRHRANDVRCDVASNSTYVYAYGFAEDIDASHAPTRAWWFRWCGPAMPTSPPVRTARRPRSPRRLNFQARLRHPDRPAPGEARDQARRAATDTRSAAPGTALALRNKKSSCVITTGRVEGPRQVAGDQFLGGIFRRPPDGRDRAGQQARLGSSPELPGARTWLPR